MSPTPDPVQPSAAPEPTRRRLLKTAGVAAAGTAAVVGAPFIRNAKAAETTVWKIQTSWPAGVGLNTFKAWANSIKEKTGGELEIKPFAAKEVVGDFELLDGARARRIEWQRFEQIDPDVFSAESAATKEREESGGLQQQESAGFIAGGVLIGVMERIGRCDCVQRHDAGASHKQFSSAEEEGVPEGLWGDAAIELADHSVASLFVGSFAQDRQHIGDGFRAGFALPPFAANLRRQSLVAPPGAVRRGVPFGRIIAFVIEQGIRQRAQDRLGMAPSDVLQSAPTVGHIDGLVADVAEVAGAEAAKNL